MQVDSKLFQILVDRVRDYAIFVLDPQGHIVTWNAGAQSIKGYAPEEIIGKHFSVFYPPDAVNAGWPAHELKVATREGRFEDEGWRVRKDGSRFWANIIITALRDDDGALLGFSKITRDLTQRRLHEERVRHSEERFRLLIEGVTDYAIFMLDPEGMVTSWNAGAQKMKGYTRAEILGRHFSAFYEPADIEKGEPWHALAAARRDGRVENEGWRLRKSGERFWARVVVSALYDAEGKLRGFAKVTQDLSQRERARELEKTAQRVNEFIAMLAHELRNPLAPIRHALQVMQRTAPGDPAHEAMRTTIERQSAHLMRIVEDMLDIGRITRGSLAVERKTVDLAEAAARAVEMATPGIEQARQTLQVSLPPTPLILSGDSTRLTQVVSNLLTNANRFTPAHGRIALEAAAEGGQAILRVRDNGVGIGAEYLESIFDMFFQAQSGQQPVGGGLGIGLALARRIVELHGGTIEARSEGRGRGSEFTVRLPLLQSAAEPHSAASAMQPHGLAAKRILIVDDNADAANTLAALLASLGHETTVVYDGPQAMEAENAFRPDVVLLDIGLPGMSGYEVAKGLRARRGRKLRIIAVSGWGHETDRARSREAGIDLHLVKPVDEAVLLRLLEARSQNGNAVH